MAGQFYSEDSPTGLVTLLSTAGAAFSPTAFTGLSTVNSATQTRNYYYGLQVVIDITTLTGTAPAVTFTIQGVDAVSGKFFTVLATTALAATGTTILTVYPGATVAANATVSTPLPYQWRVIYTTSGTAVTNLTATVAAYLIP